MVPKAVVACLAEARRPNPQEIEAVAARIWGDIEGCARSAWPLLAAGSRDRRRTLALARAALGLPLGTEPRSRGAHPRSPTRDAAPTEKAS